MRLRQLIPLSLGHLVLVGAMLHGQPPEPIKEIYQDVRGRRVLLDEFKLAGPDLDAVVKPEDAGMRVTLPAQREQHLPIEIDANFVLSGDFEITATYEILSAAIPTNGYGVGVAVSVASDSARSKFAQIGRMQHPKAGSAHRAQFWAGPGTYVAPFQTTDKSAGQLRLLRKGASLRYLVSDAPGQPFREVFYQEKFGAEDLTQFKCEVVDSGTPGNPIDARLIDLRVRMSKSLPDNAAQPAPLAAPAPVAIPVPPVGEKSGKEDTRGWLIAAFILAITIPLVAALAAATVFFLRGRKVDAQLPNFACPECGKQLKVKPELAGKKVKCPGCGEVLRVPARA